MRRLRELDIEAIAGVVAAVTALVLHLLHVADEALLLAIILVILALVMVRDMRREVREERETEAIERAERSLRDIRASVALPDVVLVGPARLREASARFSRLARGEMIWFNVCLSMFEPQSLFDVLLRPAIENREVTRIQFVLDPGERDRWERVVLPKIRACKRAGTVAEPVWVPLEESVSCILSDTEDGREAFLSFWGEPFMARSPHHDIPRYIFHVQHGSELVDRLREFERAYRVPAR